MDLTTYTQEAIDVAQNSSDDKKSKELRIGNFRLKYEGDLDGLISNRLQSLFPQLTLKCQMAWGFTNTTFGLLGIIEKWSTESEGMHVP